MAKQALLTVSAISARYPSSTAVQARAELERAEVMVDRGRRVEAAEILDTVVDRFPGESRTAAQALLRRIDLLGVAYAPEAIAEAYRGVLRRFPKERAVVRQAAHRIVEAHLGQLDVRDERERRDNLRRLIERYGRGPVRAAGRWALVDRLVAAKAWSEARVELERLVVEAETDRLAAARALRRLAEIDESQGRTDLAVESWRKLRSGYPDLPGFATEARAAITRVSLRRADELERAGRLNEAQKAYRRVIDNDLTQIEAHRRYFALSSRIGRLDEALDEARTRVERSDRSPVAHYAYGLALTWLPEPDFSTAQEEIDKAIALNPQLIHAYITRGWIQEMRLLEDPGLWTRFSTSVVEGFGRALGGLLDLEIGQRGPLEIAVDDYKTALRLNPESADPKTEAEILRNLGNAHYRLAEQTNDQGNMRVAFERYLDAMALGLEHRDPRAELVFFERLGRAAAWIDEPAVGAMATRRALRIAERAGITRRTTQLLGNLALLYTMANEDAYARDALARFEARRSEAGARSGLVVALRNRARARLESTRDGDPVELDRILTDLRAGRRLLTGLEEMERGALPSLWLALGENGTRAQFGFDRLTEEDLNLLLTEVGHASLGDRTRVRQLRKDRAELVRRIIAEVPSVRFGFGAAHPTPLSALRERLGLRLSEVRALADEGRFDAAFDLLSDIEVEVGG